MCGPGNDAATVRWQQVAATIRTRVTVDDLVHVLNMRPDAARALHDGRAPYTLTHVGQIAAWLGVEPRELLPVAT